MGYEGVLVPAGSQGLTDDDKRPAVIVRVIVKRNWVRYIWSIGYIMAALGISGSSAFLLDPQEDYADRLEIIFTLLLASVAFQVVVDDKLPNMPYLSFLEIYIIIMNCGLLINAIEVVISKSSGWEDDHFWIHYNFGVWVGVQVVFGLAAGILVLPRQNAKLYELSPLEKLSSDSSKDQKKMRDKQVEYKDRQDRQDFLAIYSSKEAKSKGHVSTQAVDKKWAKKSNKIQPAGVVGPGVGTSVGVGVCEVSTASQSFHDGGLSWWKQGAGGGDSLDDPRAVEKQRGNRFNRFRTDLAD